MGINDIFQQRKKSYISLIRMRKAAEKDIRVCPKCKEAIDAGQILSGMGECPKCGYYLPLSPKERIRALCDPETFKEMDKDLKTKNPLHFPGYEKKLREAKEKCREEDSFVAGSASIHGINVAIGVLDGNFMMGSMGCVAGEKIARLAEFAQRRKLPLLIFSASGGARMQEGLFSLMQMAKTAQAVERFKEKGGLFISFLTNPTTGGVSASFASLGDIILAEPDALICFAGPRVIEQTIGQTLPEGFQHAEFLLEHGMIDGIVERKKQKAVLYRILSLHIRKKDKK